MIDTEIAFKRFDISPTSVGRALRDVTLRIETEETADQLRALSEMRQCEKASEIIHELIGVTMTFDSHHRAVLTAQAIVQALVKNACKVDDVDAIVNGAIEYVDKFLVNTKHQYFFARKETTVQSTTDVAVSTAVDVKVAVRADGVVKKGGREQIAKALYQKYVVEAVEKPTNKAFKALLVKEAGLTLSGSSTYAYNMDKQLQLLIKEGKSKKK